MDMNLLRRTRSILHANRLLLRRRLGQNFLIDEEVMERMTSYADLNLEDTVLDIGAGLGFLTEVLAERCRRVVAVEVDPKLVRILKRRLRNRRNITILEGNILKIDLPPFDKVVATPPYSISTPLLLWLLERRPECSVLTFQREFAERLTAPVGSREYGILAITAYYKAHIDLLDLVSRDSFWPQPEVESRIVRLKPKDPPFKVEDESFFFRMVKALFTQRNKKVRNAVKPFLASLGIPRDKVMEFMDSVPFHDKRVFTLPPEDLGMISNDLLRRLRGEGLL